MPTSRRRSPFPPDEQGAASLIEIGLGKGEHLLDVQSGSPKDHDQPA